MPPNGRREALVEAVFAAYRRFGRVLHKRTRVGIASGGLTFPRVLLLRIIAVRGKSSSKQLASVMGVTTANIPGLLDKLEADGYIRRERDTGDRRIVYVQATARGRKKLKELWRAGMRELTLEFEDWSQADIRTLRDLLTRVGSSDDAAGCRSNLVTIQPMRRRR